MLVIYNFFLTLVILILLPILLTKYKFEKIEKRYKIWIHCSSLGEVKMAIRLISFLLFKFNIKNEDIIITTTTKSAKIFAKNFHNDVYLFPIDYLFFTYNFVKKIKPKILIILETELWPNYLYFVKRYNGKIFLLNGRLSINTFVFLKTFKFLFYYFLKKLDLILVREKIDYIRFKKLGLKDEKLKITGNMKYDEIEDFKKNIKKENFGFSNTDLIVTFGSIREKEEKHIIKIIKNFDSFIDVKFIIAPRHLKLIKKIIKLLNINGIKYVLKSKKNLKNQNFKCLLLDTYGELKDMYYISDIVFIGGTILPYGGQNMIEAASLGKLVIFGKYISNFLEPAMVLLNNKAAIKINNIEEFNSIIKYFLNNKNEIYKYGENARSSILKMKGVTKKNVDLIYKIIGNSI